MKIKREYDEKENKFPSPMMYAMAVENDIFFDGDLIPFSDYNDRLRFFKEVVAHLDISVQFCAEDKEVDG